MRGESDGSVAGVEGEELGTEFGEVDFLGVGAAVGVCSLCFSFFDPKARGGGLEMVGE